MLGQSWWTRLGLCTSLRMKASKRRGSSRSLVANLEGECLGGEPEEAVNPATEVSSSGR